MCPGGGVPCRAPIPPTVSLDLDVTFKTADGVFNEAFTATVQYVANATSVLFQATLPATKIAGSYPIALGTKDQVELVFTGVFEGAQFTGGVSEVEVGALSIGAGSWTEIVVGDAGSDASPDH
jgi:hypothetical protein